MWRGGLPLPACAVGLRAICVVVLISFFYLFVCQENYSDHANKSGEIFFY